MQRALFLSLMLLASGCSAFRADVPASGEAICAGLLAPAQAHAGALAEDGTDRLVESGWALIAGLGAACKWEGP